MDNSVSQKWCARCEQTKEIAAFGKEYNTKSGYRRYCKKCLERDSKRTCRECKEVMSMKEMKRSEIHSNLFYCPTCWEQLQGKKKCIGCKEIKEKHEFQEDKSRLDGYEYYCKDCRQKMYESKQARLVIKRGTKLCITCKKSRVLNEFYPNSRMPDGLETQCRSCTIGVVKEVKDTSRERYLLVNSATARTIKYHYGITPDQYQELLDKQQGLCAICGRPELKRTGRRLAIDHCHVTGKVRGLLCSHCNTGLGLFYENVGSRQKAISYLQDNQ